MVLHRFTVVAEDKAGVLARVTSLLGARGENILRLSAVPEAPALARITAEVMMTPQHAEFVVRKLSKLVYVLESRVEASPGVHVIGESLWPAGEPLKRYAGAAKGDMRLASYRRECERVVDVHGDGGACLQNAAGMV